MSAASRCRCSRQTRDVNLEADKAAFRALMHHLHEIDGEQHTVILVQVENESGAIDAVRDHSPAAEKQFDGQVPAALVKALGKQRGNVARGLRRRCG